jgi:hypothetical protein
MDTIDSDLRHSPQNGGFGVLKVSKQFDALLRQA